MMDLSKEDQLKFDALSKLADKGYEAFLYDCDGTLADNMQAHKDSYVEIAKREGVKMDPAIIDEFAGLPIPLVVVEINKRYKSNLDPVRFEEEKSALFYNNISSTRPICFVVEHLKANVGKKKIAVVSGSSGKAVSKTLEVIGINSMVEVIVCAGDTRLGKPNPDPFLMAAEKLGVSPEKCLVFEDGDAGVNAAKAAGMDWVRIDKI